MPVLGTPHAGGHAIELLEGHQLHAIQKAQDLITRMKAHGLRIGPGIARPKKMTGEHTVRTQRRTHQRPKRIEALRMAKGQAQSSVDQMRCRQRGKILETASLQRQSAGRLRCQGAQALDGRRFAVDGVDASAGMEQHAALMARATAQIDGRFICRITRQRVKRLHQQGRYLASLGKAVVVRPAHGCDACGVISPSTTG